MHVIYDVKSKIYIHMLLEAENAKHAYIYVSYGKPQAYIYTYILA